MAKAMVPASVIADMVCQEIGDNTGSKKFLILQYLALGFQHMNLFLNIDKSIKTEIFQVGTETQFEMGCGFVYETKVGLRRKATATTPAGRIMVLKMASPQEISNLNDTQMLAEIGYGIDLYDTEECDCYFYNSEYGILRGYGRGYCSGSYYSIKDGVISISPYLHQLGEDIELVVEHVNDVLTEGLILVPSEAFQCLHQFAHARLNQEGVDGKHQLMYESHFKTLARLYVRKRIDQFLEIYY